MSLCSLDRTVRGGLVSQASIDLSAATAPEPIRARPVIIWLQIAVLMVVVGTIYHGIITGLVRQWWTDPDFSHGFFVPIFSGFVIWQKRKQLARLTLRPSWTGLLVVSAALIILIAGVLGAELFLSRSSFVLLLAGLIIFFAGWRFLGAVFFAWAVLFLMIPIPAIIYNQITFPLQFLASKLATELLSLIGVPVFREGNVIHLPALNLEVVEACSGIRSLMSLGTLAIVYGYFVETRVWKRVILALAAIPIAVAANGLRIMGTGLLGQYWNPDKAEGFFHEFSGWVIFVLSVAMLFLLQRLINLSGALRAGAAK
jgi:exosortase